MRQARRSAARPPSCGGPCATTRAGTRAGGGGGGRGGAQAGLTMVFAVLGFLSPANRGSLLVALLLMFVIMGCPAGYVSAVFCKMFKGAGTDRLRNTLLTATVFPGAVFAVFFVLNLLIWGDRSTGAVPFGTLVALLVFWFGMSLPLVFVGSWAGFRRPAIEHPVRTNAIPRQIPEQAAPPPPLSPFTPASPQPRGPSRGGGRGRIGGKGGWVCGSGGGRVWARGASAAGAGPARAEPVV